jgi:hypothetical protein
VRKLKLAIEKLEVESFQTSATGSGRGTVLGASGIQPAPESVLVEECATGNGYTGRCCGTVMVSCVTDCNECPDVIFSVDCTSLEAEFCPG